MSCYLVVDSDPPVALALTFDPHGPLRGSDLPAQLECVSWPTDAWPVGEIPEGVDAARVAALGEQMVGPNGGDSVVVIHGGKLVYENYADGISADSILGSFSMSKSFTSTIVGLLVDEGKLALDARAPIDAWAAAEDPRHAITLRNLLNMASGLAWNENYSDPNSDVFQMVLSPDNAAYVIAKPLEVTPGSRFHYSTGDTMVLAKIIGDTAGVSGDSYATYLHDQLLDPLGINPVVPAFDASGTWAGGYGTNTTTRNFAKLGLLYLRDGVWEDEQFLSSDWVEFVRTPGPSPGYGGQFWLNGDGSFSMIGLLGQSVQIVPQLDLIVAVNNGGGSGEMVDLFRNAEKPSCGGPGAVAVDDSAHVTALKSVDIDVLGNDTAGPAGLAAATLTVSDPPAHGMADIVHGRIRYRSDTGFTGTDTLAYVVCTNDRKDCVEAEVSIEVAPLAFEFRPPLHEGTNVRARRARGLRALPHTAGPARGRRRGVGAGRLCERSGARRARSRRRRAPRSRPAWGRLALVVDELDVDRMSRSRGHPRRRADARRPLQLAPAAFLAVTGLAAILDAYVPRTDAERRDVARIRAGRRTWRVAARSAVARHRLGRRRASADAARAAALARAHAVVDAGRRARRSRRDRRVRDRRCVKRARRPG